MSIYTQTNASYQERLAINAKLPLYAMGSTYPRPESDIPPFQKRPQHNASTIVDISRAKKVDHVH